MEHLKQKWPRETLCDVMKLSNQPTNQLAWVHRPTEYVFLRHDNAAGHPAAPC